ncbi:hypothetical protein SCMC78_43740 [Streptomyces sp. CMC78]|uniref:Uncharacterized protein n=1 Tax=Streptomyces sp. CMC78 TaxID=3231512 RepID=A0AB33KFC3_9ACTN
MDLADIDGEIQAVEGVCPAERLVESGHSDCRLHDAERTLSSEVCEVNEPYKSLGKLPQGAGVSGRRITRTEVRT